MPGTAKTLLFPGGRLLAGFSGPTLPAASTGATYSRATRSQIPALAPVSKNLTGMNDPLANTPLPSGRIGGSNPLHDTITLTMNVPWLVFPDASVAVQVTGVLPSGNCAPDGGLHFTFGFGSTLSVAVTV